MRKYLGRYPNGAQAVRVLGHVGAVAFSRTSDFEQGKFNRRHVLRQFVLIGPESRRRSTS
jgi:hypothetical protein